MIHYNVWLSFKAGVVESDELKKVDHCLGDLKARSLIHDYQVSENRTGTGKMKDSRFHVDNLFKDTQQFGLPFKEVADIGVHAGRHGFMIENVAHFIVEVAEDATP